MNETDEKGKPRRRTAPQIELDTFAALVTLLYPLSPEQRKRLFDSALCLMPENLNMLVTRTVLRSVQYGFHTQMTATPTRTT